MNSSPSESTRWSYWWTRRCSMLSFPDTRTSWCSWPSSWYSLHRTFWEMFWSGCVWHWNAGHNCDLLWRAFHHETVSMVRVTDQVNIEIEEPRLAVIMTCTGSQLVLLRPGMVWNSCLFAGYLWPSWRKVASRKIPIARLLRNWPTPCFVVTLW